MAFMGMNMAQQAGGMNAQNLFAMGQQAPQVQQTQYNAAPDGGFGMQNQQTGIGQQSPQQTPPAAAQAPTPAGWTCSCGQTGNTGKFCAECGAPQPTPADSWTCVCGAVNKGKFCANCGKPKPAGVPQYRCDKCGWEPEDKTRPPKFCPECGDPFDDGDIV